MVSGQRYPDELSSEFYCTPIIFKYEHKMSLVISRICQCRDISNKSKRDKTNLHNIEIQIPELHKRLI